MHGSRAGPLSKTSRCVELYFYSKNYRASIWTSGIARLPISRLKEVRSRVPGWKFLHINTRKRTSPVPGMKIQRYRHKLFLTTVKTIKLIVNTREIHPAYQAVSLSGPTRLPYKHKGSNRLIYQSIRVSLVARVSFLVIKHGKKCSWKIQLNSSVKLRSACLWILWLLIRFIVSTK